MSVAADKSTIALTSAGASSTTDASTTFTFTNKAGGSAINISSATLNFGTSKPLTISFPNISVPSGFSCADGGTSGCSTANLQFSSSTIAKAIKDADLFGQLPALNGGQTSFPVEVDFAGVMNALTFTVNVSNPSSGTTTPNAPAPVLVINNTEAQPYSNILSVTVSGGIAAGVAASQVILEVTDASGLVDTTSYVSKNASSTFSVDTTKYPDGVLSLRAVAIDANNQTGTSATKQVQIRNLVAPSFDLVNPTTGSTVNGSVVAKVQIRRNNTAFTFPDSNVTFNILDYRGQVVRTLTGPISQPNPGVYEATATFDINGPQFPNNIYTVEAKTAVLLTGESAARTLQTRNQFTTQNSNNKPPALIIQMPARPNTYDLAQKKFPVINRNSGVMVQISDDNNITNVQMQLTCDVSIKLPSQTCPASEYQINFPINKSGLLYRVFNIGTLLDGEPYVENGNYILRFTVSDGTNTNIQEIPVTVDRTRSSIANLTVSQTGIDPNACSKELSVDSYFTGISGVIDGVNFVPDATSTSCSIPGKFNKALDTVQNSVRVIRLQYDSNGEGLAVELPTLIGIAPELPAGSTISGQTSPPLPGTYRTSFIVEDLTTGVVVMYQGDNVAVKTNP
ncbi:hypothetical protein [Deinococcus sp.]|uniref:hypothetical protein n=1 Tax=Deinococcus sp. TaxID=47478 RepID=UPI003C7A3F42